MPIKILAADDDRAMLSLYARIFSSTGYTVSTAETFAEASALLRGNDYDLLLTDLMFPDGMGTELIKIFSSMKTGAKSLLVTGSTQAIEKLDVSQSYMEKPFKTEHLLEAVNKMLA